MLDIVARRLHSQGLDRPRFRTASEVVAWFGAVQAQEYAPAKWALGQRTVGATDEAVEQALNEGAILRTHVMRPTWHFVVPEDIRWLLALTGPRVNRVNGTLYRRLELDDTLFARSNAVIERALEGGNHLTRAELGGELERAGIHLGGLRLGYIVHRAELDAVVCSGVRRGKQHTYALLDERAPQARELERDEALLELTRRFYTSHGPATVDDFAWWSGLTKADVRRGLELAGPELAEQRHDDKRYYFSDRLPPARLPLERALLLPPYDEYTIAFRHHGAILEPAFAGKPTSVIFNGVFVVDGTILGNWRRSGDRVEAEPFRPLSAAEQTAFDAAVARYLAF